MVCRRSHKIYVLLIEVKDNFVNTFGVFSTSIETQEKNCVIKILCYVCFYQLFDSSFFNEVCLLELQYLLLKSYRNIVII